MSMGDFAIFLALMALAPHKKTDGEVGAWYLLMYAVGRFVVEFFRGDERGSVGTLSTSQFISVFMLVCGLALFAVLRNKAKKSTEDAQDTKPILPS
jgi:phosphatidylglycerol:prolipoprotein diacylglycerol transferase